MTKKKSQIEKFREKARELESDESVENFEHKLKKLVKTEKPKEKTD